MVFTAVEIRNATQAIGSGFLMTVKGEENPDHVFPYVLTADHVIRGETTVFVAAPDPNRSGELYDPILVGDWYQPDHRLDLVISPWPFETDKSYSHVPMETELYPFDEGRVALLGSPVHYVGLFAPAQRMLVRAGTFAAVDAQGIPHDPKYGYEYDCHLMDCRSYDGFSGSPCYVELLFIVPHPRDTTVLMPTYRALMVGMFTEHYDDSHNRATNPGAAVSRIGVGVMVRGEDIRKALLCEHFVKDRAKREAEGKAIDERVAPTVANNADAQHDTMDSTENLLGEILKASKDETNDDRFAWKPDDVEVIKAGDPRHEDRDKRHD
jgi:hypothetical protein